MNHPGTPNTPVDQSSKWRLNMRIGTRLNLLIGIVLLILVILTGVALNMLRSSIVHEKQEMLQNVVDTGLSTLGHYGKLAESGALTKEAAQAAAKKAISAIRYDGNNYLFVVDTDVRMLVQPIKPEMEGKDASDVKDPDGVPVIKELVGLSKQDGWHFLEYQCRAKARRLPWTRCPPPSSTRPGAGPSAPASTSTTWIPPSGRPR